MTARPILFSGPMVRALLEGWKTQTRRVVKPQPSTHHWQKHPGYTGDYRHVGDNLWRFAHRIPQNPTWDRDRQIACPYGQPGDLLWVRETWLQAESPLREDGRGGVIIARAAYTAENEPAVKWQPSIFMPRWASRLTLLITDVRVQRLQDIDGLDAMAEGLIDLGIEGARWHWERDAKLGHFAPWRAYRALWESINGPGSWDANPWVWALTFDVIKANVSEVTP